MGKYSRRAAMGLIAGGASLWIYDTGAFSSVVGDRRSDVNSAGTPGAGTPSSAIIGLGGKVLRNNASAPTGPQTFTIKNNSPTEFTANDSITISSSNERFRFRLSSDSDFSDDSGVKTLGTTDFDNKGKLPFAPNDTVDIQLLTASDQSGTVTDTITFNFDSGTDGLIANISKEASLYFRATANLVYAVDGDIRMYDALSETPLNPPESGKADSVGSLVTDVTGDEDADIAYVKDNKLELTQAGSSNSGFPKTVFDGSEAEYPKPNNNKTRVAAGDLSDWPLDTDSNLSGAAALFTDKSKDRLYAAQPNTPTKPQAVEGIADTSNVGGAAGVTGIEDIDADGRGELVYLNSSQQLNFIEQIDTTEFSSPSDWVNSQSNYDQVLPQYKDGNGGFTNDDDWQTVSNIAFGKAKLGNAGVGLDKNVGISPPGNYSNDSKEYIGFVDNSSNLAFIDHTDTKTTVNKNLNSSSVALKTPIAPVDVTTNDTTELLFIGDTDRSGANGPLPSVDYTPPSGTGPVYYLSNPRGVLDNDATPDFKLLRPPESVAPDTADTRGNNGVVKDGDGNVFIVPDSDVGLNAGTVIK